jgi:CheY-like chemotaxis protein
MARVFVVDDDPVICRLARHILEMAGHEVVTLNDGEQALRALEESLPDVLITDLMMPRMDGFELLGRIRSDPRWAALPVIILTARGSIDDRRRVESAGMTRILTKPFSSAQLADQVNALCSPN